MTEKSPERRRTAAVPEVPGGTRRPRHLLDPADVHGSHVRSQGTKEALTRVQTWVISVLVVTTVLHLAAAAALTGVFSDRDRLDARISLNVLAAVIGMMAVTAGRLIHRANPVSWWLLLGLVPGLVGAYFTFLWS